MKYLIALLATVLTLSAAYQPDLRPGLDPTGKTNITAAQLYQMVQFSQPGTNKGFIIRTNNLPDITTYPRYTNYMWIDLSGSTPAMKVYYGNGTDNNSTNWLASAVGASSVVTASIADYNVTSTKIATNAIFEWHINNNAVTANKISALSINNSHLNASIVSNANIATRTIQGGYSGNIALATITHTNIGDGEITASKLASGIISAGTIGSAQVIQTNNIFGGSTSNMFLMTASTATQALWRAYITFFASATSSIPSAAQTNSYAHGLGGVPTFVRFVLVNLSTDLGYLATQEVDLQGVINGTSNPISAQYGDTTNVFGALAGNSPWYLREQSAAVTNAIDKTKWAIKAYAMRINQ